MSLPANPSFLVFGAGGHIGGPCVEWLAERHPTASIRAVTSRSSKVAEVQEKVPGAEVTVADYLDADDMMRVFDGIDAAFVVTPDFLDERTGMANVVAAVRGSGKLVRLIRLIGDPPGLREEETIEEAMAGYDAGTAVQHLRARKVLTTAGVPVVYMNVAAWFMNDFSEFLLPPIVKHRTLVMPYDRPMNYIDARDIGRAAAELLLDPSRTEVGQTVHLHNGIDDLIPFSAVADIMTEAFGVPISYDGTNETFLRELADSCREYFDRDDAVEYYLAYCRFELNQIERLRGDLLGGEPDITPEKLGFKARPFRDWLVDHRDVFIPPGA